MTQICLLEPLTQTALLGETCTKLPGFEPNLIYQAVSRIVFQPTGRRLSLSNYSCAAVVQLYPTSASLPTNQSVSILTNQDSAFLAPI